AKPPLNDSYFHQFYLQVNYGVLAVMAGRQEQVLGLVPQDLSSGSLGISNNARPLPRVGIGIPKFTKVPYTKGFLEVKGFLSHGWFEEDRWVTNAWLHQKYGYLKIAASKPVSFTVGMVHHVQWGGTDAVRGDLPSGLSDFWRVFRAESANQEADDIDNIQPEVGNALGNHLGIYDLALDVASKGHRFRAYHQVVWEDGSSSQLFLNEDGLTGLYYQPPEDKPWWPSVTYEVLHTKVQSGPGTPDPRRNNLPNYGNRLGGRDDYYNNGVYRDGWTYYGRIIGNALFFTADRAEEYFTDLEDFDNLVVNNRITAHHLGLSGRFSKRLAYRGLFTFARNFGTYTAQNNGRREWASIEDPTYVYEFGDGLDQFYLMTELRWQPPFSSNWELMVAAAADFGDLGDNIGGLVGLRWQGFHLFQRASPPTPPAAAPAE
ncbi:MAG: capsule assembly Wzi family protein, partial [Bacteroidota bacterium]